MKRLSVLFLCLVALWALPQPSFALEISEGVITTQVVDRNPVDEIQSYSASVGTLYCFTRINGASSDTHVSHVWYWQGKEMARVDLPVRSSSWRTWSSKKILSSWTGEWAVEILDSEGNLLKTISFQLI